MYAISEIFLSIQGEGYHAGRRAVFVRFAGCNAWTGREEDRGKGPGACSAWCDTDFRKRFDMTAPQIAERVAQLWGHGSPFVVLTGGEPALQYDPTMKAALDEVRAVVAMESNGSIPLRAWPDWLTVSPKKGLELAIAACDEVKVVHPSEIDPLDVEHIAIHCRYVQPMNSSPEAARECAEFVLRNPRWRVGARLHAMAGVP